MGYRTGPIVRLAIAIVCLHAFPPSLQAAGKLREFGLSTGGRLVMPINVVNHCPRSSRWNLKIKGLKLATAQASVIDVAPAATGRFVIELDASEIKKSKVFRGTAVLKCRNCKKCEIRKGATRIKLRVAVIDLEPLRVRALEFARAAALPIRPVSVQLAAERITRRSLQDAAMQLLRLSIFLSEGGEVVSLSADEATDDSTLEATAEEMIDHGLVRPGQYLAEMTWQREDAGDVRPAAGRAGTRPVPGRRSDRRGFVFAGLAADEGSWRTRGAVGQDGSCSYEPVLYFNSTKDSGPRGLLFQNGFGTICVEVDWRVKIRTDGCQIKDPDPHFSPACAEHCWAWKCEKAPWEKCWCQWNDQCPQRRSAKSHCASDCPAGEEECIKWGVDIDVTTGWGWLGRSEEKNPSGKLCALSGIVD